VNTNKITLGDTNQTAGLNILEDIGGATYVGSGGIVSGAGVGTNTINLGNTTVATAPVIAASADWSSSLNMTLTKSSVASGSLSPTFQAADSSTVGHNITLSGILSGTGGMTKTGAGTLTLTNANTYSGGTTVSNGTLIATSLGTGNVTVTNTTGGSLQLTSNSSIGSGANLFLTDTGTTGYVFLNYGTTSTNVQDTILGLSINGTFVAPGQYTSPAEAVALNNATPGSYTGFTAPEFSGTGVLNVAAPEPSQWVAFGLGAFGLGLLGLRARRRAREDSIVFAESA
jgi:fibronectin-binding autotransporter adhesin